MKFYIAEWLDPCHVCCLKWGQHFCFEINQPHLMHAPAPYEHMLSFLALMSCQNNTSSLLLPIFLMWWYCSNYWNSFFDLCHVSLIGTILCHRCRVDLNQTVSGDQHSPLHAITAAKYALLEISQVIVEATGVDLVIFMFILFFCFMLKSKPTFSSFIFVQVTSWCNVISWVMCVSITFLRFLCVADFKLVRFDFLAVTPKAKVQVSGAPIVVA